MYVLDNVPLTGYTTMRLGGIAAHLVEITSRDELREALAWATEHQKPVIMIGGGSNIFWSDKGFNGLVIVNKMLRFETFDEDEQNVYLTVGAGEVWDSVVERAVKAGYSGIESLSLIPGLTGATPVQNVGAYGQEIKDVLVSVEAYDTQTNQFVAIPNPDCAFGYRTSRFKTTDKGRFYITAITLHLTKSNPVPPFYRSLQEYLNQHQITAFTPQVIRDAVIAIRQSRLPDPSQVANNGSFFHNPIVSADDFRNLQAANPEVVYWQTSDGRYKVSAAWLIDQVGFNNKHDDATGMATWPQQSLVLINEHAQTTSQLLTFKQQITDAVAARFGVTLQQEPELLGD